MLGDTWTFLYTNFDVAGDIVDTNTFILYGYPKYADNSWVHIQQIHGNYQIMDAPYGYYRMMEDGLHRKMPDNDSESLYLRFKGVTGDSYFPFMGIKPQSTYPGDYTHYFQRYFCYYSFGQYKPSALIP